MARARRLRWSLCPAASSRGDTVLGNVPETVESAVAPVTGREPYFMLPRSCRGCLARCHWCTSTMSAPHTSSAWSSHPSLAGSSAPPPTRVSTTSWTTTGESTLTSTSTSSESLMRYLRGCNPRGRSLGGCVSGTGTIWRRY